MNTFKFTDLSNLPTESELYYPGQEGFGFLTTPRKPKEPCKVDPVRTRILNKGRKYRAKTAPPTVQTPPPVKSSWSGWVPFTYNDHSGQGLVNLNWREKPPSPKTPPTGIRTRVFYR